MVRISFVGALKFTLPLLSAMTVGLAFAQADGGVSQVCDAARGEAQSAFAAAARDAAQSDVKELKDGKFQSRAKYQASALQKFWKKMNPQLRGELVAAQKQGLEVLQDSTLTPEKRASLFDYNRMQIRERLSTALGTAGYDRQAGFGNFDNSIHMGFLGIGPRISRLAEVRTQAAPDLEIDLCVSTALVRDNCEILHCPNDVAGTTAESCMNLSTGGVSGADARSACSEAGGKCELSPVPAEAAFIAQYMRDKYPACVGGKAQ